MIPKSLKEKIIQIDNWDSNISEINFNGILILQANTPSLIQNFSIFLDRAYEYDFLYQQSTY